MYYIYKHTCISTGKSYIGKTNNIHKRWIHHRCRANGNSQLPFHNALRKYGEDAWNTKILGECSNEKDALLFERKMIKQHKSLVSEYGYNLDEGGKSSPTLKGKRHPLYGKHRSAHTKQKISKNHADVKGSNNPNSKTFILIDPNGNKFKVTGKLKQFCKEYDLPFSTVCRQLQKGIKPTAGKFVGWTVNVA